MPPDHPKNRLLGKLPRWERSEGQHGTDLNVGLKSDLHQSPRGNRIKKSFKFNGDPLGVMKYKVWNGIGRDIAGGGPGRWYKYNLFTVTIDKLYLYQRRWFFLQSQMALE